MPWAELVDVAAEQAAARADEAHRVPLSCPLCGEALTPAPAGQVSCRFGDFVYPRDRALLWLT